MQCLSLPREGAGELEGGRLQSLAGEAWEIAVVRHSYRSPHSMNEHRTVCRWHHGAMGTLVPVGHAVWNYDWENFPADWGNFPVKTKLGSTVYQ